MHDSPDQLISMSKTLYGTYLWHLPVQTFRMLWSKTLMKVLKIAERLGESETVYDYN